MATLLLHAFQPEAALLWDLLHHFREEFRDKAYIPHLVLQDELMRPKQQGEVGWGLSRMHLLVSGEGPSGWLNNILCPILLPPVLFHKERMKPQCCLLRREGKQSFLTVLVWKRHETSIS